MLGASNFYTMRRILLPLVMPTALAVGALSFNSLLSELNVSAFLAHPVLKPLGIVIKNATSGETVQDSTALIFVYTVFLMVFSGVTIWAVYGEHGRLKAWRQRLARGKGKRHDASESPLGVSERLGVTNQ